VLKDLVAKSRSYRRFEENFRIPKETLVELVDLARLCPSGANLQPLKFAVVSEKQLADQVFPLLKFAAYLQDWDGPAETERPAAYIVVMVDERIKRQADLDAGIAAQTMMLGAVEKGFSGCMMSSVQREKLAELLGLPNHYQIVLVMALGKPSEQVVVEDVDETGNIKYYRDEQGVHHVPKRTLQELIWES
jgi:nitroreductase